jgi:hypothetical protein
VCSCSPGKLARTVSQSVLCVQASMPRGKKLSSRSWCASGSSSIARAQLIGQSPTKSWASGPLGGVCRRGGWKLRASALVLHRKSNHSGCACRTWLKAFCELGVGEQRAVGWGSASIQGKGRGNICRNHGTSNSRKPARRKSNAGLGRFQQFVRNTDRKLPMKSKQCRISKKLPGLQGRSTFVRHITDVWHKAARAHSIDTDPFTTKSPLPLFGEALARTLICAIPSFLRKPQDYRNF